MRNVVKWTGAVVIGLAVLGCEKSDDSTPATPNPAPPPAPTVTEQLGNAGNAATTAAKDLAGQAGDAANALVAQANQLFEQAKTYINEKKFDQAATAIASLEGMKSKLPADWAAKIDELKTMLDNAKKAVGNLVAPAGN